jgi:FMN-dependent NADH-azoreductase
METLLHISASPRGSESESLAIARTYLDTVAHERPDVLLEDWDLWDGTLPAFGADAAAGKYAVFAGAGFTAEQGAAWAEVRTTFERFTAADAYLFSVPMWNHGVPYILKQFIDVVSQPGMVFGFDPVDGYAGLVTGRKAVVVYTSAVYGDERGPAFGTDFQAPYFDDWLRWVGITDVDSVFFRPNLVTDDADCQRESAHTAARDLAKRL